MVRGMAKKRSQAWLHWFAVAALIGVVTLVASVDTVLAQELDEKEKQIAILQYTLPYRFDSNLKVGDWVKYQIVREGEEKEEIELKVTKKGKGGVWIIEKHTKGGKLKGFEVHLLVDLKNLKLVKGFALDEKGQKLEGTPLGEKRLSQIIEIGKKEWKEETTGSGILGWEKGADAETITAAGGSLDCCYLEPIFSEEQEKQAQDYGMSVAEMKQKTRVYFSEDVPRLLPMMVAGGWAPFIEVFEEVKGGLVSVVHLNVELVGHSGQE